MTACVLGACDSGSPNASFGYGYASGASCTQYSSCDTCTPVVGCGWCYEADGTGTCASGPDQCTTNSFAWTWDPSGCRVAATPTAQEDASTAEDAASDTLTRAADATSAADAPGVADAPNGIADAGFDGGRANVDAGTEGADGSDAANAVDTIADSGDPEASD